MCIVIDTDTLSRVFNVRNVDHPAFAPVLKWIETGKGFTVYGGSKYKTELRNAPRYLAIFTELRRSRKTVEVKEEMVDADEEYVRELEPDPEFNDPHIVAIFRVSRCRLLCSKDAKSDRFIKAKRLYNRGQKPPFIYRSRKHVRLLRNTNIVKIHNTS